MSLNLQKIIHIFKKDSAVNATPIIEAPFILPTDPQTRLVPEGYVRDCEYPWREAFIHADRGVRVCCTSPVITQLNQEWDLEAVVNGKDFREFRKNFLNGNLDYECQVCPIKQILPKQEFKKKIKDFLGVESDVELLETKAIDKVWLEVTSRCNLRCTYCHLSHEDIEEVDLDMTGFSTFLVGLKNKNVREIIFNGRGENTFLQGWDKYVRKIIDAGFIVTAVTNLSRAYDNEEIDVFSMFQSITVSVDTTEPKIFTAIRRKADIKLVLYNILRIRAHAQSKHRELPVFVWNMIIHDQSIHHLPQSVSLGIQSGVTSFVWSILGATPEVEGALTPKQLTELNTEEFDLGLQSMSDAKSICMKAGVIQSDSPGLVSLIENICSKKAY